MRLVASILLAALPAFSASIPRQYIVELSTEPVAVHTHALVSREAALHRASILAEQDAARRQLALRGARVLESTATVLNALIVEASAGNPQPWSALSNVKRVSPVLSVAPLLDHAVVVNGVADAWTALGGNAAAGRGVKIGIIDTGIDVNHPGFQGSALAIPAGFPLVNQPSDLVYTNNKIIVARSYVSLLPTRDPDLSANDRSGHGTAVAMTAAGLTATGPLATITGVAPGAWIGSYKVFGTPGYNDQAANSAILKALDDAVADGMNIINISSGSLPAPRLAFDPLVAAVENASALGVIVTVAAGNGGPDPNTIASPGSAPSAISMGAQSNERAFADSVLVAGSAPIFALAGNGPAPSGAITAVLTNVAGFDGTGLACNALPPGSLGNQVALVLRGNCTFETKIDNAAAAGALGVIIYAAPTAPDAIYMSVGAAALPALMVSSPDGLALAQAVANRFVQVTLSFTIAALPVDAHRAVSFSSAGPSVANGIKPDLLAVGQNIYLAAEDSDPDGPLYSADGFILAQGTSFAAPLAAGTAAIMESARPGLTWAQYRSLIVNSAAAVPGDAAQTGAGSLNAAGGLAANVTVAPATLSFGVTSGFPQFAAALAITNVGTTADTFTIGVVPNSGALAPSVATSSVTLAAGTTQTIPVALQGSNLAPGAYSGFITVAGTASPVVMRAPYWFAVPSNQPAHVTVLSSTASGSSGQLLSQAIVLRITDAAGVIVANPVVQITVTQGNGQVTSVASDDASFPGVYEVEVRLGASPGINTFHITAGAASADVSITGT